MTHPAVTVTRLLAAEHPHKKSCCTYVVPVSTVEAVPGQADPPPVPECIIGHAFEYLGGSLSILPEGTDAPDVFSRTRFPITEKDAWAGHWLETVQAKQDSGLTWGRAVEYADEYYKDES